MAEAQAPPPTKDVLTPLSKNRFPYLNHIPKLKDVWCEKASQIRDLDLLKISNDVFASTSSYCLCLFPGAETNKDSGTKKQTRLETSGRNPSGGRNLTNVLLAANILVFAAQFATRGELLFWGAKINSLIDRGEIWRLVTSSFLHSGILHLMVNCYSLNSVGPTVESLTGAKRFLAVYFTSAIASSTASYWLCKGPSVGASGAVFGLDYGGQLSYNSFRSQVAKATKHCFFAVVIRLFSIDDGWPRI
ncbi:RHOMBOID-like protein 10, chloroplastic [Linum perenne]